MAMTILVTVNVRDRIRGFLASCMLEIAPGVYTNPQMTPAVRNRIWAVLTEWMAFESGDASVLATWPDRAAPSGQAILRLGRNLREIVDRAGVALARGDLVKSDVTVLEKHGYTR